MALFSKNKNDTPTETVGFMHHLEALRWHLVRAAAAILFFSVLFFINKEFLFDDIIFAPRNPDFWTYRALCDFSHWLHLGEALCISIQEIKIINTDLSGQFTMHMWAALVAGLVLGFPYLAWEMWRFIKPALYDKEIKNTRGVVLAVSILFVVGVLFGYYIIAVSYTHFLATYQITAAVENYISMDSFISNVTTVSLMSGVVFELPVVVYFLSLLGIMSPSFMRNYRRHAVVVILIVAAIITPSPDVTSQMLVAIPLYVLYEASIFVSMYVEKDKAKKAALL
ncbi:MAG: twin-arginine translocase subunit TatC [Bacteroidia bacterium]